MRLLKSREAAAAVDVKTWPTIIDTGVVHGLRRLFQVLCRDYQRETLPLTVDVNQMAHTILFEYLETVQDIRFLTLFAHLSSAFFEI